MLEHRPESEAGEEGHRQDAEVTDTFGRDETVRWSCRKGDYVVWCRPCGGRISVEAEWEIQDGDWVTLTSRRVDLPPGFMERAVAAEARVACLTIQSSISNTSSIEAHASAVRSIGAPDYRSCLQPVSIDRTSMRYLG